MPMCFIKYAAVADALDVAQSIVAVSASRTRRLLGLIFRTNFSIVNAGQYVHALAAERFLSKGIGLVHYFVTTGRKHRRQWAVRIIDVHRYQGGISPVILETPADHLVNFGPGACWCSGCGTA